MNNVHSHREFYFIEKNSGGILFRFRSNIRTRERERERESSRVEWLGSRLLVFLRNDDSIMSMSAVETMIDRSSDNPWIPWPTSRLPRQQKEELG